MKNYYLVTIKSQFEQENENGKLKLVNITENYLVKGKTITHAEEIINALAKGVYDNFKIITIKEVNITEFILDDDSNLQQKFYLVGLTLISTQTNDKGKEKIIKQKEQFVVKTCNVSKAETIIKSIAEGAYDKYEIKSVREYGIISVIREEQIDSLMNK